MLKLNIKKIGLTSQIDGETSLITEGDMPPDCVVVFMDKDSWEKLREEMKK